MIVVVEVVEAVADVVFFGFLEAFSFGVVVVVVMVLFKEKEGAISQKH